MRKQKPLVTTKDLDRAIRKASLRTLRRFAKSVAETILLDHDDDIGFVLNPNKDLDGADVIQHINEHLEAYGFWPEDVECSLCGRHCSPETVHLHQGKHIGTCCWDDRLKASE